METMATKLDMRAEMPVCAAWIDMMREVFGKESVDAAIRRGMRGGQGFYAVENGHTLGTPVVQGVRIGRDARGNSINLDCPDAPKEAGHGGSPVAWEAALDQSKE